MISRKEIKKIIKNIYGTQLLWQLKLKMNTKLACTTSSKFYNSLNKNEKRAALNFCKAAFNGFAPKTCEDYIPNNEEHFILEIDKDGSVAYYKANDTYFENLFLDDRIRLDTPSKDKVIGCRTIDKKNGKLFYNEAPYFRTKRPKKDKNNK